MRWTVKDKQQQVVTLDPGVRGCGLAVWDSGALVTAVYLPSPERVKVRGACAIAMAQALALWLMDHTWCEAVVEWPVQRNTAALRARRSDVSDLLGVASACALVLSLSGPVHTPTPEEWKGGVPKHIHTARVIGGALAADRLPRVKGYRSSAPGQLSALDLDRIEWTKRRDLNHNIVDAIGIGVRYYS